MPDGSARRTSSGEDAVALAEYLHGSFYTREARLRNGLLTGEPARVQLARLTVPQYRHSRSRTSGSRVHRRGRRRSRAGRPEGGIPCPQAARGTNGSRSSGPIPRSNLSVALSADAVPQRPPRATKTGPGLDQVEGGRVRGHVGRGAVVAAGNRGYTGSSPTARTRPTVANQRESAGGRAGPQRRRRAVRVPKSFLLAGRPVPVNGSTCKKTDAANGSTGRRRSRPRSRRSCCGPCPAGSEEVIPAALPVAGVGPGDADRLEAPFPAGRPQRRVRAGHVRQRRVGRSDDGGRVPAWPTLLLADRDSPSSRWLKFDPEKVTDAAKQSGGRRWNSARRSRTLAFRRPLSEEQKAGLRRPPTSPARTVRGPGLAGRGAAERAGHAEKPALPVPEPARRRSPRRTGRGRTGTTSASSLALSLWDGLPDEQLAPQGRRGGGKLSDDWQDRHVPRRPDERSTLPGRRSKLTDFFTDWLVPEGVADMA